ncbi:MAG: heterodisulfide reductase [Chloroflexi bacterium]|nr:heterodisulfide reductase [Chloroflexota bacterium]
MEIKTEGNNDFIKEISSMPGGEKINLCIQCGTCSGSCPNANKMDYTPRELIAMARAGMRDQVLSSNSMWLCLSCYMCTVRCPRGIVPTYIMHALEHLAMRHHVSSPRTRTPTLYKVFSKTVHDVGYIPRFGCMGRFYLQVNPFGAIKNIPVALSLLQHGRMPITQARKLKPESLRQFQAILDKAETLGRHLERKELKTLISGRT